MLTTSTSAASTADAVRRGRQAQQTWSQLSVPQRLRPVRALRHLLVTECDALCDAVARDIGKPAEEAIGSELLPLAAACRFLERQAKRLLRPRRVPRTQRPLWLWGQADTVHRRPRGLIGIIGTWNYPLMLNGVQIVQAVTAGNGVVWKPSEVAPASAAALARLFGEAGFPAGLVQVLPATREAGKELAEADMDHVVFTGSSATGRRLAETLGRRLITSTLELSGCDAMFVLDDADVALAAKAAWFGVTLNRGQTCIAVRRVLIDRKVYAAFVDALRPFVATAAPVRLALTAQAEQAERLAQAARDEGASLLRAIGANGNGTATGYAPTVVLDARPEMAVCREASFAPLLAVMPYNDLESAFQMEAECSYALGASIFTRTLARADRIAARLRPGAVVVNDVIAATAHPATPFGGRGESGWGVTQGAEGLLDMTVPQVVSTRGGTFRPHYEPPGSPKAFTAEMLRGLLQWGHAATFGGRWLGLRRLLRGAGGKA